ncbi:hypothetical protein E2L08_09780 [Palleronia sediminis]|uniref:Uncharacterized protein n=1 Tax=Palleronia sediminis TaxID=2547833 RepID=A0A4R6A9S1_9RHOB|nr:hypothetical protein [Palleronia sediminis]TDL79582.1 hypothetical protein E2L08_09780 [Palleronia sediminis]
MRRARPCPGDLAPRAVLCHIAAMSNAIALVLGLVLIAAIWADLHFGTGATLFLARELNDLLRWLAFWR